MGLDIKAMIVDDSMTIRKIIKTNLDKMGINNVLEAGDGEAAIRLLAANTDTGILFLDYNMPILNGFQTVKKMREYPNLAHIKIVMVSSAITKPLLAEFQNLGIAGFISKPFDMQKFNDIVLPILEAPMVGGTFVEAEGIAKSDVLRLFGSESPMVSFDGKKIAFNFQTEKITLDADIIARCGSIYTELSE